MMGAQLHARPPGQAQGSCVEAGDNKMGVSLSDGEGAGGLQEQRGGPGAFPGVAAPRQCQPSGVTRGGQTKGSLHGLALGTKKGPRHVCSPAPRSASGHRGKGADDVTCQARSEGQPGRRRWLRGRGLLPAALAQGLGLRLVLRGAGLALAVALRDGSLLTGALAALQGACPGPAGSGKVPSVVGGQGPRGHVRRRGLSPWYDGQTELALLTRAGWYRAGTVGARPGPCAR